MKKVLSNTIAILGILWTLGGALYPIYYILKILNIKSEVMGWVVVAALYFAGIFIFVIVSEKLSEDK